MRGRSGRRVHDSLLQTRTCCVDRASKVAPGLVQDEGPVMITETEEVTDQLRTQARFPSICLSRFWSGSAKAGSSLVSSGSQPHFGSCLTVTGNRRLLWERQRTLYAITFPLRPPSSSFPKALH